MDVLSHTQSKRPSSSSVVDHKTKKMGSVHQGQGSPYLKEDNSMISWYGGTIRGGVKYMRRHIILAIKWTEIYFLDIMLIVLFMFVIICIVPNPYLMILIIRTNAIFTNSSNYAIPFWSHRFHAQVYKSLHLWESTELSTSNETLLMVLGNLWLLQGPQRVRPVW